VIYRGEFDGTEPAVAEPRDPAALAAEAQRIASTWPK
jgi:hypothetical protein